MVLWTRAHRPKGASQPFRSDPYEKSLACAAADEKPGTVTGGRFPIPVEWTDCGRCLERCVSGQIGAKRFVIASHRVCGASHTTVAVSINSPRRGPHDPLVDWRANRIARKGHVAEIGRCYREWVNIFEKSTPLPTESVHLTHQALRRWENEGGFEKTGAS